MSHKAARLQLCRDGQARCAIGRLKTRRHYRSTRRRALDDHNFAADPGPG